MPASRARLIVLITDLDNTLYDFADLFSHGLRAMIHVLSKDTHISENILYSDFKEVFNRHGTLEYTFAVQELPCLRDKPSADLQRLIHIANVASGRSRRKRLKLYPNVKETLSWASQSGVKLCIATNAPVYQAYRRLRDLGILSFFSAISSREGIHIPQTLPDHQRKYDTALAALTSTMRQVSVYAVPAIKPRIDMLRGIQNLWPDSDAVFYSIGDNVRNDLYPSSVLGMSTIWARYGTMITVDNLTTMREMTPFSNAGSASEVGAMEFKPTYIVDDFAAIRNILPVPQQLSFF